MTLKEIEDTYLFKFYYTYKMPSLICAIKTRKNSYGHLNDYSLDFISCNKTPSRWEINDNMFVSRDGIEWLKNSGKILKVEEYDPEIIRIFINKLFDETRYDFIKKVLE